MWGFMGLGVWGSGASVKELNLSYYMMVYDKR